MKQRVPFYYNEFGCITSECKDNCCIGGWEIDIDDETYERYNNMTGELKHKILDSITQNEDTSATRKAASSPKKCAATRTV